MKWEKRIEAARKRAHFTDKDIEDAANWRRCATGEIYAESEHPLRGSSPDTTYRYAENHYTDTVPTATVVTTELGYLFEVAVRENAFATAFEILEGIERYAPKAIQELDDRISHYRIKES